MSAEPGSEAPTNGAEPLLRMRELAERSGVPAGTIKHYLREGLLPEPVKTSRNMAYYPPEFVERIQLIKQLQEERFMPLRVIRELLDSAGDDLDRVREVASAGDEVLQRALAPQRERIPEAELLERHEIPARALERLTELGVLSPTGEGYTPAEARIVEAIASFRAAGWNESTGFTARDVKRLMDGLQPVITDELQLVIERFTALDPERAAELVEGGASPFPDLIGALHAKLLGDALERSRG